MLLIGSVTLAFSIAPAVGTPGWHLFYSGDQLPDESEPAWTLYETFVNDTEIAYADGILHLNTTSENHTWMYHINASFDNSLGLTVEVSMKVESYPNPMVPGEIILYIYDGTKYAILLFYTDVIVELHSGLGYAMNTTDSYHVYLFTAKESDFKIYVDGELRVDGTGEYNMPWTLDNMVAFGDFGYGGGGQGSISHWDYVNCSTPQAPVGGISIPIDKLTLLAPHIALTAAAVTIITGSVYAGKRWLRKTITQTS